MDPIGEKIDQLHRNIQELAREQSTVSNRLLGMIEELERLKNELKKREGIPATQVPTRRMEEIIENPTAVVPDPISQKSFPAIRGKSQKIRKDRSWSGMEEFAGTSLAGKAGILIILVGVFIGAKYAIDENLVSPLVRILAGYLAGLILCGISFRLKEKYRNFSAVLLGGGCSVLYFITYIAYGFYSLLPQFPAFFMMLLVTGVIVYASFWYDRVVIAHLGQVGAYAIPFLLSDNSGQYAVLFTYISIINVGMLVISFRKYWKSLQLVAFILTWIIYLAWFLFEYRETMHRTMAWTFAIVNYLTFYASFLSYKLVKKEPYSIRDVFLILSNAFIFYGAGYAILQESERTAQAGGLFSVLNAALYFGTGWGIRQIKKADRSLVFLLFGLAIVFLVIAVPVQFDGNWVTLLWAAETGLLFLTGRMRKSVIYEKLSVLLLLLTLLSMVQDWGVYREIFSGSPPSLPFLNISFFTSLFVTAVMAGIRYIHNHKRFPSPYSEGSLEEQFFNYVLPTLLVFQAYGVFFLEIDAVFVVLGQKLPDELASGTPGFTEFSLFRMASLYLYTLVYAVFLHALNICYVREQRAVGALMVLSLLVLLGTAVICLPGLNNLGNRYFHPGAESLYFGFWNFGMRYLVIFAAAVLLLLMRMELKKFGSGQTGKRFFDVSMLLLILNAVSLEYLFWMNAGSFGNQYKLGLSIIWGIYALLLILCGIRYLIKHRRLMGMALFVVTLVKVFVYDISASSTLSKTISYITLGAMLLLVSYLYNRYKDIIMRDDVNEVQNPGESGMAR